MWQNFIVLNTVVNATKSQMLLMLIFRYHSNGTSVIRRVMSLLLCRFLASFLCELIHIFLYDATACSVLRLFTPTTVREDGFNL